MAGPNTSDKVPQSSGTGLEAVIQLADLLGGKRQTTTQTMNPGDVAALQKVVADAEAQDFTKLLESIFAQAQGAIPQVGANYGRRMGRSYGNVGAQSALNEILKQATLEGQKQIAEQQMRNRELQANAGAVIAQATKVSILGQAHAAREHLKLQQTIEHRELAERGAPNDLNNTDIEF